MIKQLKKIEKNLEDFTYETDPIQSAELLADSRLRVKDLIRKLVGVE